MAKHIRDVVVLSMVDQVKDELGLEFRLRQAGLHLLGWSKPSPGVIQLRIQQKDVAGVHYVEITVREKVT